MRIFLVAQKSITKTCSQIHFRTFILLHFRRLFSLFYNPIYLIKVKYPLNSSYKTDLYNMRMFQITGENSIIYIKIFIAITFTDGRTESYPLLSAYFFAMLL